MSVPTPAALLVAREIYAREPHHKYEEEHIIAAALIADKHMVPREVPLHDLREAFTNLRTTLYGLALDARQAEVAQRAIDRINKLLGDNLQFRAGYKATINAGGGGYASQEEE